MGKYHGIGGFRIGKVGNERYYLRKSSNVVAIAKPYKAINSQWIKQEEFKAYILSLLNVGVPQVYVLDALPEALFPYALLFIQNNNSTSLYLDKDGERTELHISGGGGGFEPTQPQLAAMNSGITTEKRESYDLSVIGVEDLKTRMLAAETGLGDVETSLESKADKESTYTKTDVNVMLDVKADKLTTYTKTEVDDAIDTLDTKLDRLDVSVDTKLELKLDRRTSTGLGVYCHNGSVQGELSVKTSVASSPSDTSVLTEKAVKTYADSIKTDVNNKLDKRTDDGLWLYSHVGGSQGALHVLPVVESVATDFDILTAKAVKTYVDKVTTATVTSGNSNIFLYKCNRVVTAVFENFRNDDATSMSIPVEYRPKDRRKVVVLGTSTSDTMVVAIETNGTVPTWYGTSNYKYYGTLTYIITD